MDDDESFLKSVSRLLSAAGYSVHAFGSAEKFLEQLAPGMSGCVLADLQMPGLDGLELQELLAKSSCPMPVVFLSAQGDIPTTVQAMRRGAEDFLTKLSAKEKLLDAIDRDDFPHMREELGDLLLHVVMHAQMAAEAGRFDFEDVAREVNEKLVRRHPHVFGERKLDTAGEVINQWEAIKAGEKKNGPAAAGVFKRQPPQLSALLLAREAWKQIGRMTVWLKCRARAGEW